MRIELSWAPPTAPDLAGILLMRRTDRYPTLGDRFDLDNTAILVDETGDPSSVVGYLDYDVTNLQEYYYAIWAYDDEPTPNYSDPAGTALVTARANLLPVLTIAPNPSANATAFSATIGWSISEPCRAVLRYGINTSYGSSASFPSFINTGTFIWGNPADPTSLPLAGSGATYYWSLTVTDSAGATATQTGSFSTAVMNPSTEDTEPDLMLDSWEILHFGNTTTANGASDQDSDGLLDYEEYRAGTDPNDPDTDDDGLSDYDEVMVLFTDPFAGGAAIPEPAENDPVCGSGGGAPLALSASLLLVFALYARKRETMSA
jgi:hypothetical protein